MIVRPRLHWMRMLFVWRGSVVPDIVPQLLMALALSCAVVWGHERTGALSLRMGPGPLGLLGVTLAIFLGFRNSTSYERFWEARKLWGALLIVSRSVSRQAMTLPTPALRDDERRAVATSLGELARALNVQLRGADASLTAPPHSAARTVRALAEQVHAWRRDGRIGEVLASSIEHNLDRLSEVIGGCERIAATPIPFVYSVMLHRTVYLYSVMLPFALVESSGWATPFVSVFVSYTLIALDRVTAELEDPFGVEPNDLPLDALVRSVERAVAEQLEQPLPEPLPVDANCRLR